MSLLIINFLFFFFTLKFRKLMPDKEVNVAVTPNGYADGIAKCKKDGKEYFVMPEEACMSMDEFLDALDDKK
jgi:peptidyl-lysine (3S)-dioxygenase / protease